MLSSWACEIISDVQTSNAACIDTMRMYRPLHAAWIRCNACSGGDPSAAKPLGSMLGPAARLHLVHEISTKAIPAFRAIAFGIPAEHTFCIALDSDYPKKRADTCHFLATIGEGTHAIAQLSSASSLTCGVINARRWQALQRASSAHLGIPKALLSSLPSFDETSHADTEIREHLAKFRADLVSCCSANRFAQSKRP